MTTMTKRTLLAMGSVMDIWPLRGYEAYMPKGTIQQRLQRHLSATGDYIEKARASCLRSRGGFSWTLESILKNTPY